MNRRYYWSEAITNLTGNSNAKFIMVDDNPHDMLWYEEPELRPHPDKIIDEENKIYQTKKEIKSLSLLDLIESIWNDINNNKIPGKDGEFYSLFLDYKNQL